MQRVRSVRAACVSVFAAVAVLGGLTFAEPAAQASQMGQGYYLFYRTISSIHANCAGKTRYLSSAGSVTLKPYSVWDEPRVRTTQNGAITSYFYDQNGFSTAYRQEWCRQGDFVYEYFGKHKVQRVWRQDWFCLGGGCKPLGNYFTAWKSHDWS
jgi:hypothetical protein